MLRYDLRLYRFPDPACTARRDGEQFEFEAEDDRAAVAQATSVYAALIAACQFAMLSSVGGRLIWQKRTAASA